MGQKNWIDKKCEKSLVGFKCIDHFIKQINCTECQTHFDIKPNNKNCSGIYDINNNYNS